MKKKTVKSTTTRRFYFGKKALFLFIGMLFVGLLAMGYVLFPRVVQPPHISDYAIHGFDVSHHQGDIAWRKIDQKHYAFVFIKATEGGDYQDPKFQMNWLNAREVGLKVGAYHFFRNCKTGAEQAENYIRTVPKKHDSLPPVMDLEFQWTCPEVTAEQLQQEITIMAQRLEQHYERKPIFYTTPKYYQAYIQAKLGHYPLWIQDTKKMPVRWDKRPWLFWQYSHTGKMAGVATVVDLNVFRGSRQQFMDFSMPKY
ncbi:MAG: lysozyme [Acinetobacter sp.]|nr:MAG: lysozyme [Acinetobacter sp.]